MSLYSMWGFQPEDFQFDGFQQYLEEGQQPTIPEIYIGGGMPSGGGPEDFTPDLSKILRVPFYRGTPRGIVEHPRLGRVSGRPGKRVLTAGIEGVSALGTSGARVGQVFRPYSVHRVSEFGVVGVMRDMSEELAVILLLGGIDD